MVAGRMRVICFSRRWVGFERRASRPFVPGQCGSDEVADSIEVVPAGIEHWRLTSRELQQSKSRQPGRRWMTSDGSRRALAGPIRPGV